MKKVLIVLSDMTLLSAFKSWVVDSQKKEMLLFANEGKEAIDIIKSQSIDLLVTELDLQEMDGLELVSEVSLHHPNVKVSFFLPSDSVIANEKLKTLTSINFIDKPNSLKEFIDFVSTLEGVYFQSSLSNNLIIADFLTLIEYQKKTCLIALENTQTQQKGFIYFEEGVLYDAIYTTIKADLAVAEMLSWKHAQMGFKTVPKKQFLRKIQSSLIDLISANTNADQALIHDTTRQKNNVATEAKQAKLKTEALLITINALNLEEILQSLQEIDDYLAAAIFDMTGNVIVKHKIATSEHHIENISVNAIPMIKSASETVHNLELGQFNFIQVTTDGGVFQASWVLENQLVAAVLLHPDVKNAGLAKIRLIKMCEFIRSELLQR